MGEGAIHPMGCRFKLDSMAIQSRLKTDGSADESTMEVRGKFYLGGD
jgi:hypothetical protein